MITYHANKAGPFYTKECGRTIDWDEYDSYASFLNKEYEKMRRLIIEKKSSFESELKTIKNYKLMLFTNIISLLSRENKILACKIFINLRMKAHIREILEYNFEYEFEF